MYRVLKLSINGSGTVEADNVGVSTSSISFLSKKERICLSVSALSLISSNEAEGCQEFNAEALLVEDLPPPVLSLRFNTDITQSFAREIYFPLRVSIFKFSPMAMNNGT